MSYILEALKKSQAERQLGSAPTLHAMPVGAVLPAADARNRKPLWLALGGGGLAVALALLAWRAQAPAVKPAASQAALPAAPAAPAAVAVTPAAPPVVAAVAPIPAPPLAVVPPSSPAPKPVVKASAPQPAPVKASAPAWEEESLPSLRQLPEAIQRAVPPLTFGGYMYSNNPADRLLLIDKTLRHEGEEIAPGLVLEKLLPKAAVMNYKGNRYRVPY